VIKMVTFIAEEDRAQNWAHVLDPQVCHSFKTRQSIGSSL